MVVSQQTTQITKIKVKPTKRNKELVGEEDEDVF
jgi:hypothetical protein